MGLARQLSAGGLFVAFNLLGGLRNQQGPKGRDLDDLMLTPAPEHHMHDAKAPPDDEGTPEQRLDLLGCGIGGHVEVLWAPPHQQVSHGTAHHVGLEAGVLQCAHHAHGMVVQEIGVDTVLFCRDFHALT